MATRLLPQVDKLNGSKVKGHIFKAALYYILCSDCILYWMNALTMTEATTKKWHTLISKVIKVFQDDIWFKTSFQCSCGSVPDKGQILIISPLDFLDKVLTWKGKNSEISESIEQTNKKASVFKRLQLPLWHPSSCVLVNHGPWQQSSKEK